jgi:hypothetical protein
VLARYARAESKSPEMPAREMREQAAATFD